jgi:hypothetical protein
MTAINFPDSPTNGQQVTVGGVVYSWNSTKSVWQLVPGVSTLDQLQDVTAGSPSDNNLLAYDTATSNWTNQTAAQAGVAAASHTHPQSDITNLTTDLAGKAATSHTHAQSAITNLVADLAAKAPLASPTFTGTVNTGENLVVNGGNMPSTSDWVAAQFEIAASSTGSPGIALHAPGASTGNLRHPRGTQAIEVSGNAGYVDTGVKSIRNMFVSTGDPSGGVDGDVWLKYTP